MVDEVSFEEIKNTISQIAKLRNKLKDLAVIRSDSNIPDAYAKWFCSKKYGLQLSDQEKRCYDGVSKFGEKVLIRSRVGSDTDFGITFDDVCLEVFDFLFLVFINNHSWMIDSVYKVSRGVVGQFLVFDSPNSFRWCGESRSLSLQLYPDEDNMLLL